MSNSAIFSLALISNSFASIDLSSLEEISHGGVVWHQNVNLCYVGDLGLYVNKETLNSTERFAAECPTSSRRRSNDSCSKCNAYQCILKTTFPTPVAVSSLVPRPSRSHANIIREILFGAYKIFRVCLRASGKVWERG